ncbi:APC family permease [Actinospica sp. MGRD01-02]|uniref:APC family permease n=1 Tax=Actinospica acidithermotolerans TaxID=2828514 RepID=A0A941EH66_9ACTN|nr:APC family permease [Actinospica acidithermotolerans]MBR7827569.1 APC family permease [Actinospica acidithermotolerans]
MRKTVRPAASAAARGQEIGAGEVLYFALASVGVLLVVSGVVPTAYRATGLTSLPLAFLIVGAVLAVFIPGYVRMTRHTPYGGAMYAIVALGLGRLIGVPVAWLALAAYLLLGVALYGLFGVEMQGYAQAHWGIDHSWWVWALAVWLLVTVLGQFKTRDIGRLLGVLSIAEIAISLVISATGLQHPAPGPILHAFSGSGMTWASLGPAFAICVLGFIGFETTAVYRREVRNPRRTITSATIASLAISALVYTVASWALDAHYGAQTVAVSTAQGPGAFFAMGTSSEALIGNSLLLTSLLAALLGYHNGWVRYVYTGARHGMLPGVFAKVGRSGVARSASLLQSGFGLATIAATAAFGWNPQTQLFYIGGTTGGLAILALMTTTSAAEVRYFLGHRQAGSTAALVLLPALAAVLLAGMTVLAATHFSLLLGIAPDDPTAGRILIGFSIVALLGLSWALATRKLAPERYQALKPAAASPALSDTGAHDAVTAGEAA